MQTLKTVFRTLARNKVLSSINLFGLALGISGCLLIILYVADELSYDNYHVNLDRIYRLSTKFVSKASIDHAAITSAPLPEELKKLPEVEKVVRIISHDAETTVKYGSTIYQEKYLVQGDADVFNVFSYKLLSGNSKTALTRPKSVVLTQSMAKKYFGLEDPMGKILKIGKKDHLVTGVMEDIPLNSDHRFTLISSLDSTDLGDWFDINYFTYVLFYKKSLSAPGFLASFQKKLNRIADEKINAVIRKEDQTVTASLHMQPLKGMHFQNDLIYDTPKGNKSYVIIFSIASLLLLIIACLNYVNFSMVQSIERSKEVGVRKIAGAGFYQLVLRYIGQSLLLTFLAMILAAGIVVALLPFFNEITSKNFSIADMFDYQILGAITSIMILVGVLAGSYPAFYTSSIKAVDALKGKITNPKGQLIRKFSVTSQFMISSGLLICTAIAYQQMTFIRNYDLGFQKDNTVVISVLEDSLNFGKLKSFGDRISNHAGVKQVSFTTAVPGEGMPNRGSVNIKAEGKDELRMVNSSDIDENFIPALGLTLKEGRNFEKGSINDFNNSIIINQAFVRMMGWKNPMQEKIKWRSNYCNIIGIVNDYHYLSLHNKVDPMIFVLHENKVNDIIVVLNEGPLGNKLSTIKDEWSKIFNDEPFVYKFLDETIAAQYQREDTAMAVFSYFSVLTIVISCLGLFGLSSLTVYQRKREIGIRKAIGASFRSLIVLFSKEYMILILISIAIIAPACWYLTDYWLKDFLFKPDMTFHLYAVAGISIISVSLITIVLSITRISNSKPSDLIRD
jgi:putative ABC transport system permease protein